MRVLIDTNVFISYLLTRERQGAIQTVVRAAFSRQLTLLMPAALLQELVEIVAMHRRLAQIIAPADMQELVASILAVAELVPPIHEAIPGVTRDPKDDYLLAYAVVGQADYLVTEDNDLLSLRDVEGLAIVTPAQFAAILAGQA